MQARLNQSYWYKLQIVAFSFWYWRCLIFCLNPGNACWTIKHLKLDLLINTTRFSATNFSKWKMSYLSTGSRGDVFVVRTSKPVENIWKNGLFWSRYSFVTHSAYRKPRDWGLARSAFSIKHDYSVLRASVALRVTCRAPARIWLAVIDFQKSIWVR